MPSSILSPTSLSPTELDQYLSIGWRPMGQRIYVSDFIQLELGEIQSVIPTRIELQNHTFKKKQRKLLRKNGAIFTFMVHPAQLTAEMDDVNERYIDKHGDKSTPDLNIHLRENGRQIFNTMQISVFDGEKLIAFSFFDVGKNSVYSKAGIYDPAWHTYSLGMYTLYLEIQWAQQNNKDFYYPGYISPDSPLFDYKTKIGKVNFWNGLTKNWLPFPTFENVQHNPRLVTQNQLLSLQAHLLQKQIDCLSKKYIFFEMSMMYENSNFLGEPYFLYLHSPAPQFSQIVIFNFRTNMFEFWDTFFEERINVPEKGAASTWPVFVYVLQLKERLFIAPSITEMGSFIEAKLDNSRQILSPIEY